MGFLRAMTSGVSGLQTHQVKMDTIGNNLANVNTTGFKVDKARFQTLLYETLGFGSAPDNGFLGGVNPQQIGLGSTVATITSDFSQGALEPTGISTDLAIEGDGFFVLQDALGQQVFTRDGSFRLNQNNQLVQPSTGFIVQGFLADAQFNINPGGDTSNLLIPLGTQTIAKATENASLVGNLNSGGDRATTGTVANSDTLFHTIAGTGVTSATNLTDLALTDGGTAIFSTGDVITVDADKGGRTLETATFVVGASAPIGGTTVGDLVVFLEDALGVNSQGFSAIRTDGNDTASGVAEAATSTTQLVDTSKNFVTLGVQAGDTVIFTSGNAQGLTATVANVAATTITFASAFANVDAPASGDLYEIHRPAGVTFNDTSDQIEIFGNLGTESDLTNLQIANTTTATNPFFFTTTDSADGESVQTSILVFDSLGVSHRIDMTFVLLAQRSVGSSLNAANTWEWLTDASDDSDIDISVGRGTLRFNGEGQFFSESNDLISLTLAGTGATTPLNIDVDFRDLTQFAADLSEVNLSNQDGFEQGTLNSISVGDDGVVTGIFTNGLSRNLAQIPLARFANPTGLMQIGGNLFKIGANSGIAQIGVPGLGGRGIIQGGTLEQSNVDLAEQFTDLITTQRGFEANARIISTANEMLQELTNLVR